MSPLYIPAQKLWPIHCQGSSLNVEFLRMLQVCQLADMRTQVTESRFIYTHIPFHTGVVFFFVALTVIAK